MPRNSRQTVSPRSTRNGRRASAPHRSPSPGRRNAGSPTRRSPEAERTIMSPRRSPEPETTSTPYQTKGVEKVRATYDDLYEKCKENSRFIRVESNGNARAASFPSVVILLQNNQDYCLVPSLRLYGLREEVTMFMDACGLNGEVLSSDDVRPRDEASGPVFPNHPELEEMLKEARAKKNQNRNQSEDISHYLSLAAAISETLQTVKGYDNDKVYPVDSNNERISKDQAKKTVRRPRPSRRSAEQLQEAMVARYEAVIESGEGILHVDSFDSKKMTGVTVHKKNNPKPGKARQRGVVFYGIEGRPIIRANKRKVDSFMRHVVSKSEKYPELVQITE